MNFIQETKVIRLLKTRQFQCIGRCLDLVYIGFGELFMRTNRRGDQTAVATFTLHLQCPFRIIYNQKLLLESNDLYCAIDGTNGDVNFDEPNTCLFDAKCFSVIDRLKGHVVKDVKLDIHQNLIILFDSACIQIDAIDQDCESWRFFKPNANEKHLVAYRNRFELC